MLIITAREEEKDKILGLDLGADDYITKPFSVRELMARVKAHIRRVALIRQSAGNQEDRLDFGRLVIHKESAQATKDGERLELTQREFELLTYLASHAGRVFSRQELMERVWNYEGYVGMSGAWMWPFGGSGKNWRTTRPSPSTSSPAGGRATISKKTCDRGRQRGGGPCCEACIKLVLTILLVVCLMAIAGAFLINSVNRFYLNEFYTQMVEVFSEDTEFVRDLVTAREGEQDGGEAIDQILLAKMGPLGVDGKNRNYYILDGETAEILASSDDDGAQTLEKLTPNLLIALNEKREGNESDLTANYMDLALPIQRGGQDYIIYILDQRATVRELNSQLFQLIIEALAFGLIISVLLSFLLSRAMVTPIRALTRGAQRVAEGDFDHKIQVESHDEIGVLTNAFNAMAGQLQATLQAVDSERTKLSTLFLHMTDGVVAFNQSGEVIHANPAAEEMLDMEIPLGGTVTYQDLFGEIAPLETILTLERDCLESETVRGERTLLFLLAPFDREKQVGVLVVVHDVTQQVKNETMRKEFVANVSHELRTPITNIRSYARPLRRTPTCPRR